MLFLHSIPAAVDEVVPAEAGAAAGGPLVGQAGPAEESLPVPPPLLVLPEQIPGGSPDAPPVSEPLAEGTTGEPSVAEGVPEETIEGSSGSSPSRPSGVLVVVRPPPREVPEENALIGSSADQGEFEDEPEDEDEMAAFKELVSVSPA